VRQHGHKILGQLHHHLARTIEAVSLGRLRLRRRLNFRVPMAEQDRSPTAHEVDVFAAIDVADAAALRGGKELRIALREPRSIQMAPHAAWNHQPRPCSQHGIRCLRFAGQRRMLGHDVLLFDLQSLRFLSPAMIGSPTIHGQLRSQSGQVAFGSQNQ
jgi:hypothetical protein